MRLCVAIFVVAGCLCADFSVEVDSHGRRTVVPHCTPQACASYVDAMDTSGWTYLYINTSNAPDAEQASSAGYLEGFLTYERIKQTYINFYAATFNASGPSMYPVDRMRFSYDVSGIPAPISQWMAEQTAFTTARIANHPSSENGLWTAVSLMLSLIQGIVQGYNDAAAQAGDHQPITMEQLYLMNSQGDLSDLIPALVAGDDWTTMTKEQILAVLSRRGHCSVLVKVLGDLSEIFFGHTTWTDYSCMIRQYKTYRFNFSDPAVPAHSVSFSGYPGVVTSIDDFYLTDSKLWVTETTNTIMNLGMYDGHVPSSSLLSWQRAMAANWLAHDAKSWVKTFSKYNSGTYNNQWIVLDLEKFIPGQNLKPDTLWIVEQYPGGTPSKDVTSYLALGYWPSYNRPFFPEWFNKSGYATYQEKYGDIFSYELNPRANIFRREQGSISGLEDFKLLMRWNKYETDPYSDGNPGSAISSRFDLMTEVVWPIDWLSWGAHGGVDSKVSSGQLASTLRAVIVSGPTHDNVPPFAWTSAFANFTHVGMPTEFNFDWVPVNPAGPDW